MLLPRFKNPSLRLLSASIALLMYCSVTPHVAGADFVWDTNTSTDNAQDGAGTWTEGAGNWFDETNTLQNQNWSNAAGNIAIFGAGGTGGNINVTGTVNAGGMIFRSITTTAYTLQGAGTIALAGGSSITIADNASSVASRINLNAVLSGNNITLQKTAGSTQLALVTLGATNTLTGTFTLRSAGALDTGGLFVQANSVGALNSATLSSVDVGTNVTLVLGVDNSTYAVPFTLAGSGAGARGAIRFEAANTTLTGAITLAENTRITQNTNATTSTINSSIGESGGSRALTFATQGSGNRTMILGGNNTFTGGLTIEIADVRINNAGALNSTAPNVVTFSDGGPTDKALSLNGFSITVAGLATAAVPTTTATVRNASATAATLTIQSTSDRSFAGSLADGTGGGALSVVKSGTFAQTLSGTNTFTGGLTLNQGTLNVNSSTALGATAGTFTINGGIVGNTSGGAITNANNNAMVWNGDFAFTAAAANTLNLGTGAVSLGTNPGTTRTVTVTTANSVFTVGGAISNGTTTNALTKAGSGILVLGGNNTYTGLTTVSAGNLRISHGNALGATDAGTTVAGGARLQLEGSITVNGESLITPYLENVSGSNTWNGSIQCAVGTTLTLDAAAGDLLISGNVNAADTNNQPHTVNLVGSSTGEVSGVLSNTFAVNKSGTGTWILSGANNYTSATNVNAGVLQVGKNGVGQTGTGAVTVVSSARLSGTGFVRGATVTLNSGSFLYAGDGIAASNHGTLTFTTTSAASYNLNTGSTITLSLGGATVTDGTFGGNAIGSAGYNAWVDSVSGAGNHDRLVFDAPSGTLVFSSKVLLVTDGFTPSYGQAFNLLDWAAVFGDPFSGFSVGSNFRTGADDNGTQFDLPELADGWFWDVSRFTTSGVILVVPEPGKMLLLAVGLAALVMRRRRQETFVTVSVPLKTLVPIRAL